MEAKQEATLDAAFDGYQSRYIQYCRAHGFKTPTEQKACDRNMANFVIWMNSAWAEFCREAGINRDFKSEGAQQRFDSWLPKFSGDLSHVGAA